MDQRYRSSASKTVSNTSLPPLSRSADRTKESTRRTRRLFLTGDNTRSLRSSCSESSRWRTRASRQFRERSRAAPPRSHRERPRPVSAPSLFFFGFFGLFLKFFETSTRKISVKTKKHTPSFFCCWTFTRECVFSLLSFSFFLFFLRLFFFVFFFNNKGFGWIEGANFFRSVSSVVVSYKVEKERDKKFKKKMNNRTFTPPIKIQHTPLLL